MRYLSLCSGIEAASVAFGPLGGTPVAFAEIEAFPAAVLAHHYPNVPNLGDLTRFSEWPAELLMQVEVLIGGTPCQAFSVAGLRNSLDDERGNLTLIYVKIFNRIRAIRLAAGLPEPICVWENVPGVLSTKDNAFGCFLGGIVGAPEPLTAAKWRGAGIAAGPERRVAWRTLDAQYFALAQRRQRVFVVGCARNGPDPAQILFECESLRRHSPPRRTPRQSPAAAAQGGSGSGGGYEICPPLVSSGRGIERAGETRGQDCVIPISAPLTTNPYTDRASEEANLVTTREVAATLRSCSSTEAGHGARAGDKDENLVAHTLRGEGFDASEDGTGRGTPLVPCVNGGGIPELAFALTTRNERNEPTTETLLPMRPGGFFDDALPFDTTQVTSGANRSNPKQGDPCHPLTSQGHAPAIAFPERLSGTQCASTENLSPALGAANPTAVALGIDGGDVGFALRASASHSGDKGDGGVNTTLAVAFQSSQSGVRAGEVHATLDSNNGSRRHNGAIVGMAVRRLTPTECLRLQGFPDDYLSIQYRGKPAADGPKYKAIGNSFAVPVIHWIGTRIQHVSEFRQMQEASKPIVT